MKSFVRTALVVILLFAAVGWAVAGWNGAMSVLIGGVLSLVNARWTMSGIDRLLGGDEPPQTASVTASFLGRLVLIFGVLFAIIHTSFLSVPGVVVGFASGVAAAFVEEFRNIVSRK